MDSINLKLDHLTNTLNSNKVSLESMASVVNLLCLLTFIKVCCILENSLMQLISEMKDEDDKNSVFLLGYKDNGNELISKVKSARSPSPNKVRSPSEKHLLSPDRYDKNPWLPNHVG